MLFLNVLSGSKKGTSAPLQACDYVCGVDDDCDFLIGAPDEIQTRIVLKILHDEDRDRGVALSMQDGSERFINVDEPFSVGGVDLMLSEEKRSSALLLPPGDLAVDLAFSAEETSGATSPLMSHHTLGTTDRPAHSPTERSNNPPSHATAATSTRHRALLYSGVLFSLIAIFLFWGMSFANGHDEATGSTHTRVAQSNLLDHVRTELRQAGVDRVLFPIERAGTLHLVGYFSSEEKRQAFQNNLENTLSKFKSYPIVLETEADLLARIADALKPRAPTIIPIMNGLGRVQLTGVLPPSVDMDTLLSQLRDTFKGQLLQIDGTLTSPRDSGQWATQLLATQSPDFSSMLSVKQGNARPTVVIDQDKACLEVARQHVALEAARMRRLLAIDFVSTQDLSRALGDAAVQTIAVSPVPYVKLVNGDTVFEGGTIGEVLVKKISEQYVYLSNGDVLSAGLPADNNVCSLALKDF